jgi:hypothetical protein
VIGVEPVRIRRQHLEAPVRDIAAVEVRRDNRGNVGRSAPMPRDLRYRRPGKSAR